MRPHAFVPGNCGVTCIHVEETAGGGSLIRCGRVAAAPIHRDAPELPGEHDLAAVLPAPQSSPAPAHADGAYPRAAGHGAASAGAELGCAANQRTEEGANRDASAGPEPCVPVLPAGSGLVARDSSGSSTTPGSQSAVVTLQDDDLSESGVQRRARRQQEVAPDHATGAEGAGPESSAGPAPAVNDAECALAGHCAAIARDYDAASVFLDELGVESNAPLAARLRGLFEGDDLRVRVVARERHKPGGAEAAAAGWSDGQEVAARWRAISDFWEAEAARACSTVLDRRLGSDLVQLAWSTWEGETTPTDSVDAMTPGIVLWHAARGQR